LCRCHDQYRGAELIKALLHARRLKGVAKTLVQAMHYVLGRSCRSRETDEAHSDRTRRPAKVASGSGHKRSPCDH
jgi:hypothetical protein